MSDTCSICGRVRDWDNGCARDMGARNLSAPAEADCYRHAMETWRARAMAAETKLADVDKYITDASELYVLERKGSIERVTESRTVERITAWLEKTAHENGNWLDSSILIRELRSGAWDGNAMSDTCPICGRAPMEDWQRRALSAEQAAEEWRRTATGAFKAREVWATAYDTRYADIERDIVERIAVWLDAIVPGQDLTGQLRAGAWKEKP